MQFPVAKKFIAATVIKMCNPVNSKALALRKQVMIVRLKVRQTSELTEGIRELKGVMYLREHVYCGYASNFCQNSTLLTSDKFCLSSTEQQNSEHCTPGAK